MKRDYPFIVCVVAAWLLIIALCVLLTVKARAQIAPGALHRLIGNPSASTSGLPVNGVGYWWVSSDMTTGQFVTNWVDRIIGSAWTNGATGDTRPTNSALGVHFDRTKSQNLTNSGVTFATGVQPSSHWVIINRTAVNVFQDFLDNANSGVLEWMFDNVQRYNVTISSSGKNLSISPTNSWVDWLVVMDTGGSAIYFYTNGLPGLTNTTAPTSSAQPWKIMGGIPASGYFTGYIRELAVWSNTVLTASDAVKLHTYATNKYGYTP